MGHSVSKMGKYNKLDHSKHPPKNVLVSDNHSYQESYKIAKLKEVFAMIDTENTGRILPGHFQKIINMRRQVYNPNAEPWTDEENAKLLKKIDIDGDGMIDCDEFVEYMHHFWHGGCALFSDPEFDHMYWSFLKVSAQLQPGATPSDPADTAEAIYHFADKDNSGDLSKEELVDFLKQAENKALRQMALQGRDMDALFADMDTNGDGMISEEEWINFFVAKTPQKAANGSSRGCGGMVPQACGCTIS